MINLLDAQLDRILLARLAFVDARVEITYVFRRRGEMVALDYSDYGHASALSERG